MVTAMANCDAIERFPIFSQSNFFLPSPSHALVRRGSPVAATTTPSAATAGHEVCVCVCCICRPINRASGVGAALLQRGRAESGRSGIVQNIEVEVFFYFAPLSLNLMVFVGKTAAPRKCSNLRLIAGKKSIFNSTSSQQRCCYLPNRK